MKNKNAIYNDDVERIVNDPERQAAISAFYKNRYAKRQRKMIIDAAVYATVSLAIGLFGCFGLVIPWLSFLACSIGGMYSTFLFGRWFENGKAYGWH